MFTKLKHDESSVFDSYLGADESILWIGQPQANLRWLFSPNDLFMIPFSLLWGGFAIFWESSALQGGSPSFFALWGIPFVVIGQYMIWGRFIHKTIRRRHTYYALTEGRALVLNTLFGKNLKTYFLHQLVSLNRQGQAVLFELNTPSAMWRRRQQDWSGEAQPGFYALADADAVYRQLQDLILPTKAKNEWN